MIIVVQAKLAVFEALLRLREFEVFWASEIPSPTSWVTQPTLLDLDPT